MSNEIVYQMGGLIGVFLGGILGFKLRDSQIPKENFLPKLSEETKIIEPSHDDFESKFKELKEIQHSLQEENVILKGKNHHFEKQIISFQNSLNTTNTQKNYLDHQVTQDQSKIHTLQNQLQQLELSQKQLEVDYQKKTQELLAENDYISGSLRHEVAKRTDLQQRLYILEQVPKHFAEKEHEKEQQQQKAIAELEQKNRELNQSKVEIGKSLHQQIERLREEKSQLEQELQQQTTNAKTLQSEIAQLIAEGRENKLSHQQAIAEMDSLKQQIRLIEIDKTRLQGELESQTEQLIQGKIEQEQAIAELDALKPQISQLETDKARLQQEQESSQNAIAELDALKPQISQLEADKTRLQQELESSQNAITELDALKPQISQLEAEKARLQQESESSQNAIAQNTQNNEELQQKISLLESDKVRLQQELESSQNAIAELDTLKPQISQLEAEKTRLQQELDSSQNAIAQNNIKISQLTSQNTDSIAQSETNLIPIPKQITESEPDTAEPIVNHEPEIIETVEAPNESVEVAPIPTLESTPLVEETETQEINQSEIEPHQTPTQTNIFADKKFIILGTLTQMNREEAKNLIQEAGGSVTSSASSKTNYVLVGKSPGEKLKKAQKLGIFQLSEAQFLNLLSKSH